MDTSTSATDLLADRLDFVVGAASRAVSVHNTQPWRFQVADGGLELLADWERQLSAADPRGRELVISCGAALYNARLAVRVLGGDLTVALLPEAADPGVLARLTVTAWEKATAAERVLFAAIPHRHTHRSAFSPEQVPGDLLVALEEAVIGEGAALHFVERPGQLRALSDVVSAADRAQRADPALQAETTAWTSAPGENRPDGIPTYAYARDGGPGRVAFPIRDFAAGRGWGSAEPPDAGLDHPVAVLTTAADRSEDWLAAGQALQRMLLLAASRWVFAAMFSQPLESPAARVLVRDEVGTADFPQMIVQLGHSHISPTTPRRPVDELVVNDGEPSPGDTPGG